MKTTFNLHLYIAVSMLLLYRIQCNRSWTSKQSVYLKVKFSHETFEWFIYLALRYDLVKTRRDILRRYARHMPFIAVREDIKIYNLLNFNVKFAMYLTLIWMQFVRWMCRYIRVNQKFEIFFEKPSGVTELLWV